MSTTSTVPTLRAALVSKLRAQPALHDVQVWRRHPGPNTKIESIWLSDVEGEWEPAALVSRDTRMPRNETFRLDVVVQTFWTTYSPEAAAHSEDRAYQLMGAIEDVLAEDEDFRSALLGADNATFRDETVEYEQSRWATRLTLTLVFHARLT